MSSPEVIEVAVKPKTRADQAKMSQVLSRLAAGDPTFGIATDHEFGQIIIKGMSEAQLNVLVERVSRELEVEPDVGAPQVSYREYLAKPVEIDHTYKKQLGDAGQFGRVKVQVAPGELGSGVQFFDETQGGNIPREYIPSVEKGMRETAETGSLIGFPIIDFEIRLVDGAYHDVDSSALAFENTGRGAMREAAQRAGIKLLEPIMKLEVVTPEDYVGDVIGDLNSRRALLLSTASNGDVLVIVATAPMATLFGIERHLKALTSGEATVSMVWERYEFVPGNDTDPDDTFPEAAALRA
jgi:elongation factor G